MEPKMNVGDWVTVDTIADGYTTLYGKIGIVKDYVARDVYRVRFYESGKIVYYLVPATLMKRHDPKV
jgi:signal peptidase I